MPHAPDLSGLALDGRYELHAVIGEGTFGRVYRGRDRRLARPVAVKVIKPWWSEDPDWVRSFEREAQLLARVSDPGIVQIFDVGHAKEGLYYVAELVDGESLADLLRRGPLTPLDACDVAEQLCRALEQAHAQRVVHRDIKPANVLISARGKVKVGDFGVARLAEGSTDGAAASIVGTPRYMAPEQARGRPTTPATDVYSVGIVLYEMLAGQSPFMEKSAVELALRHLQDTPAPLPASTPPALCEIVECALSKSPAGRYASGGAMADALERTRPSVGAHVRARAEREARAGAVATLAPPRRTGGNGAGRWDSGPNGGYGDSGAIGGHGDSGAVGDSGANGDRGTNGANGHRGTNGANRDRAANGANRDRAATAATALLKRTPEPVAATHEAVPMTPRRNVNPAARRRRGAALGLVLTLLLGMIAASILIGSVGHVRVPNLRGLRRAAVLARTRRLTLHTMFAAQHAQAPRGTAIAQRPNPGTRVRDGATVQVVLSEGPAPVQVPSLVGHAATAAQAALQHLGLRAALTQVPAPGVGAGTVTRQVPAAATKLPPRSVVTLSVAEAPRWRALTSFAGDGPGSSVPFRIRGRRWRVVYDMNYVGTCTFVFFCSGPSAQVLRLRDPLSIQFDLGGGDGQTRIFDSGPGLFQIGITPGSDTARWSMEVEDYY
jgi:hypothetical protein